jgi:hypothetical protein
MSVMTGGLKALAGSGLRPTLKGGSDTAVRHVLG